MAVKSPMEYFQEQDFSLSSAHGGEQREISPTERQFLRKYLGVDDPADLRDMASLPRVEGESVLTIRASAPSGGSEQSSVQPQSVPCVTESAASEHLPLSGEAGTLSSESPIHQEESLTEIFHDAEILTDTSLQGETEGEPAVPLSVKRLTMDSEAEWESVDDRLRSLETVTTVGFYVGRDVFVVPIDSVLEVIHYTALHRLPQAPSFLPGVVNLRGSILPVINMVDLLTLQGGELPDEHGLIIICEARGMKLGLLVSRLHTIHKAKQDKFNWNAELHLGSSAELLSGLLETDEKLLGILSVERLVAKLLEG